MDVAEQKTVGTINNTVQQQQAPGAEAQGWALAQTVIAQAIGEQTAWNRFVGVLIELSTAARAAFRKELAAHVKAMGEHVKATALAGNIKNANPIYRGAKSSAIVRLSQLTTISKALDAGMEVEVKRNPENNLPIRTAVIGGVGNVQPVDPFHTITAMARLHLQSEGKGRGRPATPFIDKLKKFINDNVQDMDKDYADAATLTATMLKLHLAAMENAGKHAAVKAA